MWDMHRKVDLPAVPDGRTVVRFSFTDVPAAVRNWWMLITPADVDLCDFDPGHPPDATVETDLRTLTMIWRGDLGWPRRCAPAGSRCTARSGHAAPSPAGLASRRLPPSRGRRSAG